MFLSLKNKGENYFMKTYSKCKIRHTFLYKTPIILIYARVTTSFNFLMICLHHFKYDRII